MISYVEVQQDNLVFCSDHGWAQAELKDILRRLAGDACHGAPFAQFETTVNQGDDR